MSRPTHTDTGLKIEAYRCTWDGGGESAGWVQYHTAEGGDDPMPDAWDDEPDEVAALVLAADAGAKIKELEAECERLRALTVCGCGDQFTQHDPGTCGACVAGADKTVELERMRERCAQLQTVAEQVLRDMRAQGLLIEWQTTLDDAIRSTPTEPKP